MSQELYTREQLIRNLKHAYNEGVEIGKKGLDVDFSDYIYPMEPIPEKEISCSAQGCFEAAFIGLCNQHYNEILNKNEELAEKLGEKKCLCKTEDQTMEPAV